MKEILMFGWPIVVAVVATLLYSGAGFLMDLRWGDHGHTRRHIEFMRNARRAGLSYGQAQDELYLNERIMQCRIDASKAVQAPGNWMDNYQAAIAKVVERVGIERPHLVDGLRNRIGALSYGQILFPQQARMIDAAVDDEIMGDPLNLSLEQFGALRIVDG